MRIPRGAAAVTAFYRHKPECRNKDDTQDMPRTFGHVQCRYYAAVNISFPSGIRPDRKEFFMSKNRKSIIIAVILVILLIGAFAAWRLLSPSASEGSKTLTVNICHLEGDNNSFTVKTDAEYLRGALEPEGIISGTESSYGLWITTVDGETADDSAQQWWGYTVNGETAMYGADEQVIADGDVIEFALNVGY